MPLYVQEVVSCLPQAGMSSALSLNDRELRFHGTGATSVCKSRDKNIVGKSVKTRSRGAIMLAQLRVTVVAGLLDIL